MFGQKTKSENAKLRERVTQLEAVIAQTGAGNVLATKDAHNASIVAHQSFVASARKQREAIDSDLATARKRLDEVLHEQADISRDIVILRDRRELQDYGLFDFPNPAESSVRFQTELQAVRSNIKQMIRQKQATRSTENFIFNNSQSKGRKFVSDMSKMMLRAYNAEAENAVLTVRAGSLDAALKRVERARDQTARLGAMIDLSITSEYHAERLRELQLAAMHLQAREMAKEQEREERARLREERKAQAELEAERKRLEKERAHYQATIETLTSQGRESETFELAAKLAEIDKGIQDVDYRHANARAGYVYVISNIGAFGDNMVKIGMTRRLNPMDRVNELGDASVPFRFDVHALFFSDDAVGVESEIHRRFASRKVNKVNGRKEFFYTTPHEVRESLSDIAGNLLEFTEQPEAEQYRESQRLAEAPAPV